MSRVVFSKGADLDIAESIEWYNKQKTGLGDIFFDRLVEKIEAIEKIHWCIVYVIEMCIALCSINSHT